MLIASLNEPVPLRILAADGRTDLYGQIRIYNATGMLVSSLNIDHMNEGIYGTTWTPSLEGYFSYVGELYLDSMRVIESGYEKVAETVDVNSAKAMLLRILGLQHENTFIDNQAYDGNRNLLSARVRSYDSPTNATAAGTTGLVATYAVTATYDGQSRLNSYLMTRVP